MVSFSAAVLATAFGTMAAYARANFEGDLGSLPFKGNIGVRYVATDFHRAGGVPQVLKMLLAHDVIGFQTLRDRLNARLDEEAEELERLVAKTKLKFCVTHNYTGYPMVKQARHMVREGRLGEVRKVIVEYQMKHAKYGKYLKRRTVLHAHDEKNDAKEGDTVEIAECRPLSKTKRWLVVEIIQRGEEN